MTNPQWLTWALDQARRDLIDLTRRNRLLHAPLGGNRPWCMAITGRSPDEIFETLYRQEKFRGYSFTARSMNSDWSLSRRRLNQPIEKADRQIDGLNFTRAYPLISSKSASQRFFASNERSKRSRASAPFTWLWDF